MRILLLVLTIVLFSCKSKKQNNNTAAKLDEFLSGQTAHYNFNGNVMVAENGEIVFQKSYGFANFDTKRLIND